MKGHQGGADGIICALWADSAHPPQTLCRVCHVKSLPPGRAVFPLLIIASNTQAGSPSPFLAELSGAVSVVRRNRRVLFLFYLTWAFCVCSFFRTIICFWNGSGVLEAGPGAARAVILNLLPAFGRQCPPGTYLSTVSRRTLAGGRRHMAPLSVDYQAISYITHTSHKDRCSSSLPNAATKYWQMSGSTYSFTHPHTSHVFLDRASVSVTESHVWHAASRRPRLQRLWRLAA